MSLTIDSPSKAPTGDYVAVIKFNQEPPTHIFINQWFPISLSLQLPRSHFREHMGSSNVKICPQIYRHVPQGKESYHPVIQNERVQFIMEPSTITLPTASSSATKPHVVEARCKIVCPMDNRMEQSFAVKLSETWESESSNIGLKVKPTMSRKITIVNAKLKVDATEWDDVWFKDMGGRDKAMQVTVTLTDQDNRIIRNRRVPLHLTLTYDNEQQSRVMKQEILRIIGSPSSTIDPDTGKASLQFRVEDVSKNHQGQNFIILITSDRSKDPDIAPGFTKPVTVRSKKKLRNPKRPREDPPNPSRDLTIHPTGYPRHTGHPDMFGYHFNPPQNSAVIRNAMRGVIKWTEEVINGLFPLKWTVIGYHQFQDGSMDYSRPYHNMMNPNESINRILSMYEEQTRENMRILISTIDQTAPSESFASTSSGSTTGLHLPTTYSSKKRGYETETHQQQQQQPQPQPQQPQQPQQQQHSLSIYDIPQGMQSHHSTMPGQSTFTQPNYWNMQQQQQRFGNTSLSYGHSERNEPDVQDYAIDEENRQGEVRYVLARQFKLIASDKQLGYPAYSITKELLGFYRKSSRGGLGRFIPIHKHRQDINSGTMTQATTILESALLKGDNAVFDVNRHDSLTDMVNEALNYESWTKNTGENSNSTGDVEIGRAARDNSPESF